VPRAQHDGFLRPYSGFSRSNILLPHYQNIGKNNDIKLAKRLFPVAQLVTIVTKQNFIQDEIKRRLNLCNAVIQSRTFCLLVCCVKT
jgi:hypothetical protein